MRKNIVTIAIIAIIFVFTSCDKNELAISEIQKSTKTDILTFATQEDFDKTLAKVNAMTKQQRLAWEKEQGFKSFGTICDEFYENIDPQSFKSQEEVKAFVVKNSDKIEFYTSSDGETYCVTKDFKINEKYLLNEHQACKIESNVVVFSSNSNTVNPLLFKTKSATTVVTEDEDYDNSSIGSDTYRIHTWINTYFYANEHRVSIIVKNFSRSLGIWWEKTAWTEIDFSYTTSDTQSDSNSGSFVENTWINSYNNVVARTAPIYNTDPFFTKYNCYTKNKFKKKDGRFCNCIVNLILN